MSLANYFPTVKTVFDVSSDNPISALYSGSIRSALRRILPHELFFTTVHDEQTHYQTCKIFHEMLPIVKWSHREEDESNFSIFLLCRSRLNVGKFFYDMISRWLLPGQSLNVELFFATDFKLPEIGEESYTISEIVLRLNHEGDLETIRRNLPILESEIRLGVVSVYQGNRILEIKGLSADEKTSLIQEKIASLIQRRPQDFDYDIFSQMQHFLVMCRDEFKAGREYMHMSRIISVFYLFQKALRQQVEACSTKRYLSLKFTKARLHLPLGIKRVLGIFVGVNFLKENEVFEQRHLIKALKNYFPDIKAVEDSFFVNHNRDDRIHTIYLEVEKGNGTDFSLEELKKLRRGLASDLRGHIEQLMRPIFMPRNEEEVMRNIVTLSHQLKYIKDMPQVIISFDEQTDMDISFTVILLRVLQPLTPSVQSLFAQASTRLKFIQDRIKRVGAIRKKYPKEATVFRLRLPNEGFLRGDHSVDLYKARQEVMLELQRIIGEVRDYNGGMLSKQVEILLSLKELLGERGREKELLLENFFHSIFPVEFRSVLDPEMLKTLFLMLLDTMEKGGSEKKPWVCQHKQEEMCLFLMVSIQEFSYKQKLFDTVEQLLLPTSQLATLHLQVFDTVYLGYLYFSDDQNRQKLFLKAVEQALDF